MAGESEIRRVIDAHAAAVRQGHVESMLADVADDVMLFDVVDPFRRMGHDTAHPRGRVLGSYQGSISWDNLAIAIVRRDSGVRVDAEPRQGHAQDR